jgi:hypothetical protein
VEIKIKNKKVPLFQKDVLQVVTTLLLNTMLYLNDDARNTDHAICQVCISFQEQRMMLIIAVSVVTG